MRTITRTTMVIVVLLTIAALSAVAQESTGEQIKHGAQKAGEKVKEAAKTVGEKTKETAETDAEKTKNCGETQRHMPAATPRLTAKAPGRNSMTSKVRSRS